MNAPGHPVSAVAQKRDPRRTHRNKRARSGVIHALVDPLAYHLCASKRIDITVRSVGEPACRLGGS